MSPIKTGRHVYVLWVFLFSMMIDGAQQWQQLEQPRILDFFGEPAASYSVTDVYPWIVTMCLLLMGVIRQFVSTERLLVIVGLLVVVFSVLVLISMVVKSYAMLLFAVDMMTAMQSVSFPILKAVLVESANPEFASAEVVLIVTYLFVQYLGDGAVYFVYPSVDLTWSCALLVILQGAPAACLLVCELMRKQDTIDLTDVVDDARDVEAGQTKDENQENTADNQQQKQQDTTLSGAISSALSAWSWSRIQQLPSTFWALLAIMVAYGIVTTMYFDYVIMCTTAGIVVKNAETIASFLGWAGAATSIVAGVAYVRFPKSRVYLPLSSTAAFLVVSVVQTLIFSEPIAYVDRIISAVTFVLVNSAASSLVKRSLGEIEDDETRSRLIVTAYSLIGIAMSGPLTALGALALQLVVGITYSSPFAIGLQIPIGFTFILGFSAVLFMGTANLLRANNFAVLCYGKDLVAPADRISPRTSISSDAGSNGSSIEDGSSV